MTNKLFTLVLLTSAVGCTPIESGDVAAASTEDPLTDPPPTDCDEPNGTCTGSVSYSGMYWGPWNTVQCQVLCVNVIGLVTTSDLCTSALEKLKTCEDDVESGCDGFEVCAQTACKVTSCSSYLIPILGCHVTATVSASASYSCVHSGSGSNTAGGSAPPAP